MTPGAPKFPGLKKLDRTRYIFVTGGVMSALGKGLTASCLGAILQARGYTVVQQKLDPYLNVDPGTMSPFQHGEVYVTDDGAETDLDLGHYERFSGAPTSKLSNITAGQIYWNILHKERKGDYLGKTVQVVPHVTNEIKAFIGNMEGQADFSLVEIGGTVGDIEGMAFIEAIRQYGLEVGWANCLYMHLTFAPYLASAGEIKTKPTQNAVRDLLEAGIHANIVVVRSEQPVPEAEMAKIALFAGLKPGRVVNCPDSPTIYRVPVTLHENGLDDAVLGHFGLTAPQPDLARWKHISGLSMTPPRVVRIGVVGKYVQLGDAYISLNEALLHGGFAHDAKVEIEFIDSEGLEGLGKAEVAKRLAGVNGILVPGGFGSRGSEGKMLAIRHARENGVPYFGICFGMQLACIEYARNVAGLAGASSTEFVKEKGMPEHPVIALMTEWDSGKTTRSADSDLGGTMRLGSYPAALKKDSLAAKAYGATAIDERHRHRYEFNPAYREVLEKAGLVFSGTSPKDHDLVEVVELPEGAHPSFFACQYHPEFKSRPLEPHPLFASFVKAAIARQESAGKKKAA